MSANQLIREKIDQATAILDEYDVDLWLTFVRETSLAPDPALELIYDGDVTWQSAFLIDRGGRHTALVGHFDAENVRALGVYTDVVAYHEGIGRHLMESLAAYNPRTIAINYSEDDVAADGMSHGMYLLLVRYLADSTWSDRLVSAAPVISALRGRKSRLEVDLVRQAIATTEHVFNEIEAFVRPGMTQREIADFTHKVIDGMGVGYAWPKPYNPIVTCGPESAGGHAAPGDVVLQRGHTLHIDLGIKQDGYCSDIQRMWYVLEEGETAAPLDVQRAFDVVLGAIRVGEQALRPGAPGWQVDEIAREFIVDNGYPEYMHAFGHLLGRSAHDGAMVLGPRWERYKGICDLAVETDNIFTLELHVNVPDRGMMSLEEDVLVTAGGVEYLSTPQTSLRYIR